MLTGFVDKIGAFDVAHRPQGADFGAVDLNSAPKGVMHTTEGNSEVPEYGSNAPHLTIGKTGLYQHRAFGRMAGTLRNEAGGVETNRLVRIQFELVGFCSLQPWLPAEDKQREMLADVFQFAKNELGVPARHVWPDLVGPGPQAVETYPRRHSKFPGEPGWYNHGEVPENEHFDAASLLAGRLMDGSDEPDMVRAYAFVEVKTTNDGHRVAHEISPFFADRGALRDWAVVPRKGDEDVLRARLWQALVENRVRVADRRVKAKLIRG